MNPILINIIRVLIILLPFIWIAWTIRTYQKNRIRLFKFQILFPALLILSLILIALFIKHNYPDSWKNIEVGQTRNIIHSNVGRPVWAQWQEKGDFWEDRSAYMGYGLNVWYNKDTIVSGYNINFYFGAIENNHNISIKLVH